VRVRTDGQTSQRRKPALQAYSITCYCICYSYGADNDSSASDASMNCSGTSRSDVEDLLQRASEDLVS